MRTDVISKTPEPETPLKSHYADGLTLYLKTPESGTPLAPLVPNMPVSESSCRWCSSMELKLEAELERDTRIHVLQTRVGFGYERISTCFIQRD